MSSLSIKTITLIVDPIRPNPAAIAQAAQVLLHGGLVAFPTETVYGLGANALDEAAVRKIFEAKGRPASDPLIVHIAGEEQVAGVAKSVPPLAHTLAQAFWPGPLTVVLERGSTVPANVSAGRETVAVRVPNHAVPLALIRAAGVPIAAPSANLFTRPSPTTAAHVIEDLGGRIDLLLDGGPTPIGLESTVLDLTGAQPALLRPGGVPIEALRQHIPDLSFAPRYVELADAEPAPSSPGMLLKHYSPRAELQLFAGPAERAIERMRQAAQQALAAGKLVGIMAPNQDINAFADLAVVIAALGPREDIDQIGRRIFAGMRELDHLGVEHILVRGVDQAGLGLAIWDRLVRAAEGRVIEVGD
ncbi:MAG TPA: L-threonylcarbamoyladenylate synthase [Roseiflexaceae bacterium]|nr:L-threonylcarbamoyladenylate synthase [Roseiflexaceae bacterium]